MSHAAAFDTVGMVSSFVVMGPEWGVRWFQLDVGAQLWVRWVVPGAAQEGELVPCELDLRLQRHPVVDWKYCAARPGRSDGAKGRCRRCAIGDIEEPGREWNSCSGCEAGGVSARLGGLQGQARSASRRDATQLSTPLKDDTAVWRGVCMGLSPSPQGCRSESRARMEAALGWMPQFP